MSDENANEIKSIGNPGLYKIICKSANPAEGWSTSTYGMDVPGGCLVRVTTEEHNPDGSLSLSEALAFVPEVKLVRDVNGGHKLGKYFE